MNKVKVFFGLSVLLASIGILLGGLAYLAQECGSEKISSVFSGTTLLLFVVAGCCYLRSNSEHQK